MPIIWDASLIFLSVLIACVGSFVALDHAQRMQESEGRTATLWMLAGGGSLGIAIWGMHFVGMLAIRLPISVGYDPFLTLFSLLPAVAASILGFYVLRAPGVGMRHFLVSGVLMGLGISTMHYVGMAALRVSPAISHNHAIVALSVAVATVASWGALLIMHRGHTLIAASLPRQAIGAVVMGLAISAMHYSAMIGLHVPPEAVGLTSAWRIEPDVLAVLLAITVMFWFGGGLLASLFDRRMARRNAADVARLELEYKTLLAQSEADHMTMISALRESEERTQMLMRNAPDAVYIFEQDGRIVYVNDQVTELLGYDRDALYSMTVFDLVPADWRDTYRKLTRQMLSSEGRQVFEIRNVTRDGRHIPLELHVVLLPNGQVYGSCRDIRERKAAQKSLKESQAHLQRIVDSLAEGMYVVDRDGLCTFINAAFLRILGFDRVDEVLGKHIHTLIHHSHADGTAYPEDECLMFQAFRSKQPSHTDQEVFWRRDGTAVPVEYWSHPLIEGGKVTGAVATFLDITERKRMEGQLHDLAFFDSLTKLPNRRLLLDRLNMALRSYARTRRHGALLFLDLDHFKTLNDLHGHDIGDQLLIEVARRILGCIREQDSAARFGGDEFVVMLEDLSGTLQEAVIQAETVAEKIRASLAQPYHLMRYGTGNEPELILHHCSSSIGATVFQGHDESLEQMLKRADMAMYCAKEAGRNAIRFFDPAMQAAIETQAAMEADLHLALEYLQFRLFYQVQVNDHGKPVGAEALLRWQHPQRGLVSPAHFIPLTEEMGLIVPIGAWVLDTACAQIKQWQDRPLFRSLVVAVNVSASQFRQADFVAQVVACVRRHDIPPAALKLELTESVVLDDVEDTIAKMRVLKTFGIGFSMDDFGTGYSSLSYLKRLPLDQIKIDQSFVRNITTDHGDTVMVTTIIGLGQSLEMDVIAEGVETEVQFRQLCRSGCASFQGYLFGKPVPVDQFERLVDVRFENEVTTES